MIKNHKNRAFIKVTLVVYALSMLLFLTPLDHKFFDLFLRVLPSLSEDEHVYALTLDDDSMEMAGGFPFKREVMADVVVLLKELGAQTIAFDLSYLDESAPRFDTAYAADVLNQYLYSGLEDLDDISAIIPLLGRDVDEYFAQALAFSDCTWLTLTMIPPTDIMGNEIETNSETDRYLAGHIASRNIIDLGDTKTPEMAGVIPAIHKLLSRSKGAGFVNAGPDSDGLRRRANLVMKYRGDYYQQLALIALQEKLGFTSIEISNKAITLKKDGGSLKIPRTQDGAVLLKWPKKSFYDYRVMSLVELIQYTIIESALAQNIALMHDLGFFYLWDGISPWEQYITADEIKRNSFAANEAADDGWFSARRDFLSSLEMFLGGSYEESILAEVGDDPYIADTVRELFDVCREQYSRMAEIRRGAAALRGSFCVIGSDATSMTDNGLNTFQRNYPNVGSYTVIANMLLSGDFLDDTAWFIPAIIALLYSLLIGFLVSRFETHLSILTGISGIILLCASFVVFFLISKTYIGIAVPLAAATLTFVSLMVTQFLSTSQEKAFLHNAFSRYIAPDIITEIINDPSKLNLGGEKREMTAIFTDIQGFSTISEQLDPAQLVKLLNRYLTAMSNIVMENLGTIDKYEGDAIIAFFGAPVFHADHPALACRSALAMKAAEKALNETIMSEKLSPVPLFTRIGINTGEMVVGNMGAENKMDYTIMGNAVNLAARLEGVNKQYHTGGILISEYTRDRIGDEFLVRRLDRVRVVGINTPLRLYELLATAGGKGEEDGKKLVRVWEKAMEMYEGQQFQGALGLFDSLMKYNPDDKVAELYVKQCIGFIINPPPADWNAVNNLTQK